MRLILLLGLSGLILACGQKGSLYLPVAEAPPPPADTCQSCPPVTMSAPAAATPAGEKPKKSESTPTATPQEPTP